MTRFGVVMWLLESPIRFYDGRVFQHEAVSNQILNPEFFLKVRFFSKDDSDFYSLKIHGFESLKRDGLRIWAKGTVYRIAGAPCARLQDAMTFVANEFSNRKNTITDHIDGSFLFFIEELSLKKIWILNNHYQVGSYHYFINENEIQVSSSFKKLTDSLRNSNQLKPHFPSIHNFVGNGFNVSDETLVKNVKRSMADFSLEIDVNGYRIHNRFHENFQFHRQPFKDLEKHTDNYYLTYQQALKDYLGTRKPSELGILLSGGHDTSFLMINASKVWKKPVHAFSVVFPKWNFDEGPLAKNICEKFGGVFHPIEFKPEHLDQTLGLVSACEEPVVGSSLPLYVLAQKAKDTTDTIMGGDGGDTIWGEYYPVGEYHSWIKNGPRALRKSLAQSAKNLRKTFDSERLWELEHVAKLFSEDNFYDGFLRKLCTYRHFSLAFQRKLFVSEISEQISFSQGTYEVPFKKDNFDEALIAGKLFNGFYTYQSHHTYKGMEDVGVEFYMPTIDREVLRFINHLPQEWVNGGNTFQRLTNSKAINRKFHKHALSRHLDRSEIYNRSFDIPWHSIMRPRKNLLNLLLKKLKNRGWYREEFLDQMFAEFQTHKVKETELLELKHHGYRIFTLLTLEIWCCEFLDGRNTPASQMKTLNLEDYLAD